MENLYFIGRIFYWFRPNQHRGRVGQGFHANSLSLIVSYFIGYGPIYFTDVCPCLFYWLLPGRCHLKPSVRANAEKTRWGGS